MSNFGGWFRNHDYNGFTTRVRKKHTKGEHAVVCGVGTRFGEGGLDGVRPGDKLVISRFRGRAGAEEDEIEDEVREIKKIVDRERLEVTSSFSANITISSA